MVKMLKNNFEFVKFALVSFKFEKNGVLQMPF